MNFKHRNLNFRFKIVVSGYFTNNFDTLRTTCLYLWCYCLGLYIHKYFIQFTVRVDPSWWCTSDGFVAMGCLNSKMGKEHGRPDINGTKRLSNAGQFSTLPVPVNENMGMSQRQIFSLKQSWKGIRRRMEETGVDMFVRLFRADKSLQQMFHQFKDIQTDEELRSNDALEAHATLVMGTLDEAIIHIDDYDYVKQMLYKIAETHVKFPGFRPETFLAMKEPFLEAVRVTLGDRYTDNMRIIYGLAITFILQTMVDGINEVLKKDGETSINGSAKGKR